MKTTVLQVLPGEKYSFRVLLGPNNTVIQYYLLLTIYYSIVWKTNTRFLADVLGFGIFLGRILVDFWTILGVIFGGFLGTF